MFSITFQKMGTDVLQALKRFPLAVASSILLTLLGLNHLSLPHHWHIESLLAILASAVLWFISVRLLSESHKWNHLLSGCVGLLTFVPMAIYLYNLPMFIFPFMLMGLGVALLTMIAPFLKANVRKEAIWQYNYRLWSQIFFSILASLILVFGLCFLLISLDYLFNVRLFHDQYFKLMLIMACFVGPMMVMSGIPSQFEDLPDPQKGKGIQILLDYVMTPLLLVFGAIIICYALKILALQNLPRGKVSYLVSILGVTGSLAYLLGESGKAPHSLPHRLFRKHFFHLMLIPLTLMGIGVGVRIAQYGVTEFRYIDALLFLWLLLCILHSFTCSREKIAQFMFVSASGLLIIGSFGPWGIMEVSTNSQQNRLQALLEKNQILVNNSITKKHPPISHSDAYEITSRVVYVLNRNKIDRLKVWFGPEASNIFNQPNPKLISSQDLTKLMDIPYVSSSFRETEYQSSRFTHSQDTSQWLTVRGYDYVLYSQYIYHTDRKASPHIDSSKDLNKTHPLPNSDITLAIKYDETSKTLSVKRQGGPRALITVPIESLLQGLKKSMPPSEIDERLTFEGKEGPVQVRLVIKEIYGNSYSQENALPFNTLHLMLFVKLVR